MTYLTHDQILRRIQWVRALLSGDYVQGQSSLKVWGEQECHCCLGVICELLTPNSTLLERCGRTHQSRGTNLAGEHLALLGMTASDDNTMCGMNDGGDSFERIADVIAWATEHLQVFHDSYRSADIPGGYATEWLRKLDAARPE